VSTASARARGTLADLDRASLQLSFDTKVIGPTTLAKRFAGQINAISPGVIDTGAWDAMGEDGRREYFAHISESNPTGTIGTPEDVAEAVLFAMTNAFLTGVTLKIDGGEPLT
jgi:NAD(P)-dependent dehydrogenase (short-subunit alcohol dehydrogenase family)